MVRFDDDDLTSVTDSFSDYEVTRYW